MFYDTSSYSQKSAAPQNSETTTELVEQLSHTGLSPNLYNSNMLEHFSLLNLKFLIFLYSHQHAINFFSLMLFFSTCCICVIS